MQVLDSNCLWLVVTAGGATCLRPTCDQGVLTVNAVLDAAESEITNSDTFCTVRIDAAQATFRPATSSSSALAYLHTGCRPVMLSSSCNVCGRHWFAPTKSLSSGVTDQDASLLTSLDQC